NGASRHRGDERPQGRRQRRHTHRDFPGDRQVAVVRGSASAERGQALTRSILLVTAALALVSAPGSAQVSADSSKAQTTASISRQGTDSPRRPLTNDPPPAQPADTLLANACREAPQGKPAPGLLTVVFRAGTPDSARVSAAKEVSGTLVRMAE